MADPLSISASMIALLGAAEAVTKIIGKIRHIHNGPTQVLALLNEVADLTVVLKNVQSFVRSQTTQSYIPQDQLQQLASLVEKAKNEVHQLEEVIQRTLIKPNTNTKSIRIFRLEWLKAKPRIVEFKQNLRDIRLKITAHVTLANS